MQWLSETENNQQPGDPEQLARIVDAAERYYEQSLKMTGHAIILVYWEEKPGRYRITHASLYKGDPRFEVVRIPK